MPEPPAFNRFEHGPPCSREAKGFNLIDTVELVKSDRRGGGSSWSEDLRSAIRSAPPNDQSRQVASDGHQLEGLGADRHSLW